MGEKETFLYLIFKLCEYVACSKYEIEELSK